MNDIEEKLIKALEKQPEPENINAVVDTNSLIDISLREIHAILASHWLNKNGIGTRIPGNVRAEYNYFYDAPQFKVIKDGFGKGLPLAPVTLDAILHETTFGVSKLDFSEGDEMLFQNYKLAETDKIVAKEAEEIARKKGYAYVWTSDRALISQVKKLCEAQKLNIHVLMPSTIEEKCSYLLPEIGLRMIVPSNIIAELCRLSSSGEINRHYVLVERNSTYRFGNAEITVDIAREVAQLEEGKNVPSRTGEYGISVNVVEKIDIDTKAEVFSKLAGGKPKRPMNAFLLTKERKYFPVLEHLSFEKGLGICSSELNWAVAYIRQ